MLRFRLIVGVLLVCGATGLLLKWRPVLAGAEPGRDAAVNAAAEVKAETPKTVLAVQEKLGKPISLPEGIDPNTSLKDALEFLGGKAGLSITIDRRAFRRLGLNEPEAMPVALPKMIGVSLRLALQRLLEELEPTATFMVREGTLVVTTLAQTSPLAWREAGDTLAPKVDLHFDRRPLEQALRDVAVSSGVTIVLDPRVGEKAKTALTMHSTQMFVDTAVALLANMADLTAVALDSALYVTTKANAGILMAEADERDGLKLRVLGASTPPPRAVGPFGVCGFHPVPMPGTNPPPPQK